MSSRTTLNPCVTAVDFGILRSSSTIQLFYLNFSYLEISTSKEKSTRTFCFVLGAKRLKPEAHLVRNPSEDAPEIADLRFCPRQNWQPSREKGKGLLTLHARGWSVESNSQGYTGVFAYTIGRGG